ncbi:hypothetical protein FNW02_36270 [Komarekiella sp. 'clone 1']|uniref:Uncharacterized protein n=1 Tax=Komarekiella delphini-convector SJRDD-AB1 TaxID=2593771 RepID=A0AA40VVG8_9NOST|nr:hypothetical protein [Komarekiella delphini-convector]MBD6621037.1 hypothetical protein [Komarekiella delphini-convector SJRDD-AB1]
MIIPFDLQGQAIATDGKEYTVSTAYVDIIKILTSSELAFIDHQMRGTLDVIAEGGGFCGEGVDEFLSDVLDELQDWGLVEEVDDGNQIYWVLTPKGVLLKAEL